MRVLMTAIVSLGLSACAVGPNYHRPLVSTPPQWTAAQARGTSPGVEPETDMWWQSFHDDELDSLIRRAAAANYDLVRATARVEESRAARGLARSNYSPQVNGGVSAARDRQIGVGLLPGPGGASARRFPYETADYRGDLGLSWELDLFGRIRRGVEAATADLAASEQDRRNVLVTLLGDVGRYYADLRGYQLRLAIAGRT